MLRRLAVLAFLCLLPGGLSPQGLPDLGDAAQSTFSVIEERRLGEEIMREIRSSRSFYDDPEATDYVNALGHRLVAASGERRQAFEFFLIQDLGINAFALPGGFIGIHTGLLLAAQSEAEVAGVFAHEIAHVTQRHIARMLAQQRSSTVMSLAALAVAVLAARSNSDIASAAAALGQAGAIQNMLNFSRDHEREADRVGLQILEAAGYDPRGMATFFERLQRATRVYEAGSPSAYLRTHPLTHERIADIQNRLDRVPYRQVPDSLDFQLVRAKLRAEAGSPAEAVAFFQQSLAERRFLSEAASRYGLAASLLRSKAYARARQEHATLSKMTEPHPMVAMLGCRIRLGAGETQAALACFEDVLRVHSTHRAATYEYAEALLQANRPDHALKVVARRLQFFSEDPRLYVLQARAYALKGNRHAQHRATGEAYARMGNLRGAVEQMQLAARAGDGDFYQLSAAEARLRELRKAEEAQRREKR
jgi:beta-barrel assembly-enhancing protease